MEDPKIFAPWPYFSKDEISAVTKVLKSGNVNQWTGNEVFLFEKEYARKLGVKYAVALVNGSVALELALKVLGIGPGDEVIVPSRSFVATASCVVLRGAVPVFADVDRESQNITVSTVESLVTRRTKAVICVHLAGWPAQLDELRRFCRSRKLYLVEDCAQAHGAKYKGKPTGSFGDVSCFSFCQDKIITTGGEGGLLVTNNKNLWQKAWSFKDHGRDYKIMFNRKNINGFVWSVTSFGSNYRMTEMQAVLGRLMLARLNKMVERRRKLAAILTEGFSKFPQLWVTVPPSDEYHSYYKYYVFVRPKALRKGWNRDRIVKILDSKGIPCGTGVCPEIYLEEAFRKYRNSYGRTIRQRFKVARELGETSIMFQVHPTLSEDNMHHIVKEVDKLL